jgi:hypothetical protein
LRKNLIIQLLIIKKLIKIILNNKICNNYLKLFYQNPKLTALSIGKHAPIPNQTATKNPKIKAKLAIGRRNGFWNLFTFSINGTVINPNGTEAIAKTPNNLFGNTRNKLNVGKKYHSGKISNGVLNGSAGSPNCVGANTDNPTHMQTYLT